MNLTFQTPLAIVILLIGLSYAASFYLYRFTVPRVSDAKRLLLVGIRGTALTFVALALCEPLFQRFVTEEKKPSIAVLVDNSLSMSQTDGSGSKENILRTLLKGNGLAKLSGATDLHFSSFSHSLQDLNPESLSVTGGTTNISNALQTTLTSIDNLHGILLLSDGNYNSGSNPIYVAEKSRVPVFTIGVGDTNEQRDISISKLLTNSIGYVGTAIPVEGSVKVSGMPSRPITVSLLEDGRKIDEKIITNISSSGTSDVPVQFSFTPKNDGAKKLTITVPQFEGEVTPKNNSRSALVKILKNKLNVVVITGPVSPDVSVIMQTLNADNNIDASLFYQMPNGEMTSRKKGTDLQTSLNVSDAVVIIGFPSAQTPAALVETIEQTLLRRSLPLLFIASRTLDMRKTRLLEKAVPFIVGAERIDEQAVQLAVVPKYNQHQILQTETAPWEKLPPIYYSLQTFTAKPEAQNILTVKIQNVVLANPLLVVRTIGNTKSAAFLGYGIHRWKILAGSTQETKSFFQSWFSTLMRWLATKEQDKYLRVAPSQEFYSEGEQIEFSGQLYNESYQPVDNADVRISLRSIKGNERFETTMSSRGSGLYEGALEGLSAGDFFYTAAGIKNGDTLGTTNGRLSIGDQSIEYAETRLNMPLMKQIANASGGLYSDASAVDALIEKIVMRKELQQRTAIQSYEFELWNLPAYLMIIILLLGTEWLIRKQSGML